MSSLISRSSTSAADAPSYVPLAHLGAWTQPRLAVVTFGETHPASTIHVPMRQLGTEPLAEVWPARNEPRVWSEEGFALAEDGESLFGAIALEETSALEPLTQHAYERAIRLIRAHGYPYFLRIWNHLGDINAELDGRERYQRFCVGRYEAFAEAGYALANDLPAASAVGMHGRGLVTYFIASRAPGAQVENPRQVSAYRYPRQYGPKSPSFSRATAVGDRAFLSGTASVVGHATVHHGDVVAQLDETLRNIDVVLANALPSGSLADLAVAKTYVRHPADFATISSRLGAAMRAGSANLYLEADICRQDLLLEIEGVAVR